LLISCFHSSVIQDDEQRGKAQLDFGENLVQVRHLGAAGVTFKERQNLTRLIIRQKTGKEPAFLRQKYAGFTLELRKTSGELSISLFGVRICLVQIWCKLGAKVLTRAAETWQRSESFDPDPCQVNNLTVLFDFFTVLLPETEKPSSPRAIQLLADPLAGGIFVGGYDRGDTVVFACVGNVAFHDVCPFL